MLKNLLCGAAALGLMSHVTVANASGVIINGVEHHGNTINVPYGHSNNCCAPHSSAPVATYQPATTTTYETVPVSTYETVPVTTYEAAPTVTYQTEPVPQSDLIYLQDAPAASEPVVYGQPQVVAAPVAPYTPPAEAASRGWGSRVYVGARGGWTAARDTDFSLQAAGVSNEYDQAGYNVAAVLGWGAKVQNGIGYRLEAELGYQSSEIDSHSVGGTGFSGSQAFGDTNTLYGFANAYVDIPIINRLNGVLGGGVGVGKVEFDGHGVGPAGVVMNDDDTAFGYHLDAGLSYDVTDRLALEAMYRYTSFVDVELTANDGRTSETDVDTHNVVVGARYGF